MFVVLKSLNNLKNIKTEIENENYYKPYGITQNPETKNYITVLNNIKCKKCNSILVIMILINLFKIPSYQNILIILIIG
ncbi:hypothetical protein RhiirA5_368436 [Rhizophagus irregularis]|uniref:Uncharacterized protein n=1 Tax=Rhizophagus irregularis TaxID=588596 RepID=A0A2N0NDI9_9GLOM|nr:hypothetical protein RhiirA5_368436 [Rhizophagus irregularis]